MAHEELIGKYVHLIAKPENYTPPTKNPKDCICLAKGDSEAGRLLIANCPCCDGVQFLVEEICNCPPGAHKIRVILPPDSTLRIRRIESISVIA